VPGHCILQIEMHILLLVVLKQCRLGITEKFGIRFKARFRDAASARAREYKSLSQMLQSPTVRGLEVNAHPTRRSVSTHRHEFHRQLRRRDHRNRQFHQFDSKWGGTTGRHLAGLILCPRLRVPTAGADKNGRRSANSRRRSHSEHMAASSRQGNIQSWQSRKKKTVRRISHSHTTNPETSTPARLSPTLAPGS
jgi:hypothetical protein